MDSGPLDGSLYDWGHIASAYDWRTLFTGNGLSINVWPSFAYRALFDHATGTRLTGTDLALFADTPNFERVLQDLNTTIWVMTVCGYKSDTFQARYRRIQEALGQAIRAVHLNRWQVSEASLAAIREHVLKYQWIFTTSYDLILYWAMGAGRRGRFSPFTDLFMYNNRCEFDPARATVLAGKVPVYFLHGALHLVVGGGGETWKLRWGFETLLNQFGQPIPGQPQARPLLVTEGSAEDKIRAIDGNEYLRHALQQLRRRDSPLVVFGSRLSAEDQHLVDALNEHPARPVAVSVYPRTKRDVAAIQRDIYARLEADPLLFFDSTTHPLGSPAFSEA
jgi:Domain of unknown function (DUF4917)